MRYLKLKKIPKLGHPRRKFHNPTIDFQHETRWLSFMEGITISRIFHFPFAHCNLHPGRLTWNIIIGVWKIILLSKWVICRFHVNLPGCTHLTCQIIPAVPMIFFRFPLGAQAWSRKKRGVRKLRSFGIGCWKIHPRTCKWLGSPPFISHKKPIWKGNNPYLGDLRSPWLLTT